VDNGIGSIRGSDSRSGKLFSHVDLERRASALPGVKTGKCKDPRRYSLFGKLGHGDRGEKIVDRHLNGPAAPLASSIAMMRLLLILSWRHASATVKGYRKSWLLNEIVPGFDAEALRVARRSAMALPRLSRHLRITVSLVLPLRQETPPARYATFAQPGVPFYQRRFSI